MSHRKPSFYHSAQAASGGCTQCPGKAFRGYWGQRAENVQAQPIIPPTLATSAPCTQCPLGRMGCVYQTPNRTPQRGWDDAQA